jgi:hypothetical protein
MDKELPSLRNANAEITLPNLARLRIDTQEPTHVESSTVKELPMRRIPNIDMLDPKLLNRRKDIELPICTKSKQDNVDEIRA